MSYTIKSARFANADRTAIVIDTVEAGAVAISHEDMPELWKDVIAGVVAPYVRPYPEYIDKRQAEYPLVKDQLDAIWKGGAAETAMRATIAAIKLKHPKPDGGGK